MMMGNSCRCFCHHQDSKSLLNTSCWLLATQSFKAKPRLQELQEGRPDWTAVLINRARGVQQGARSRNIGLGPWPLAGRHQCGTGSAQHCCCHKQQCFSCSCLQPPSCVYKHYCPAGSHTPRSSWSLTLGRTKWPRPCLPFERCLAGSLLLCPPQNARAPGRACGPTGQQCL